MKDRSYIKLFRRPYQWGYTVMMIKKENLKLKKNSLTNVFLHKIILKFVSVYVQRVCNKKNMKLKKNFHERPFLHNFFPEDCIDGVTWG